MDLKAIGLVLAGLCAGVVFLARAEAQRDPAAPSFLEGLMAASDRLALGEAGRSESLAVLPDGSPVPATRAFTSYRPAGKRDAPSLGASLAPFEGCEPSGLAGREIAYAFATGPALARTGLYPFASDALTDDVEKLVRWRMKGDRREIPVGDGLAYAMRAFDVAVTETRAPVVLVLQTTARSVVWNIHAAPGATISRVVLLGGVHVAVAGLADDVAIDVLDRTALHACNLEVSFPPPSDHIIHRSVALNIREAEASLSAWKVRDRDWADWTRARFGTDPGLPPQDEAVTAFVAGPVPEGADGRAVFRPLNDGTLRMIHADHLFAGKDWQDQYRAAVTAVAEDIAGQPLDALAPITVEERAR